MTDLLAIAYAEIARLEADNRVLADSLEALDLGCIEVQRENDALNDRLELLIALGNERLDPQWALVAESDAALRTQVAFLRETAAGWREKAERYRDALAALIEAQEQERAE